MNKLNYKKNISKIITVLIYCYLVLPFIIFIAGYCLPWIAALVISIVIISLVLAIKVTPEIWIPDINLKILIKIFVILYIILNFVVISGIGNKVYQNGDHSFRNPMFQMLVDNNWPVVMGNGGGETRAIIYYIGFWMPSAVIGKIFGVDAGYNFQIVWAVLGIFLMYCLICSWRKKFFVWPILVIFFFGGLDYFIVNLFRETPTTIMSLEHLEFVGYFSSMTTQLFWPFNQAIPSWLTTMFLFNIKGRKNLIFILSTLMISATLPFVGMIPFVVYFLIFNNREKENSDSNNMKKSLDQYCCKKFFKEICTFQNVVGGGVIGILSFLFLIGNTSGQKVELVNVNTVTDFANSVTSVTSVSSVAEQATTGIFWVLLRYSIVIMFEVGFLCLVLYNKHKKNKLFYVVVGCLLIMPFGQVGEAKDFCMRASIPALFILMLFVIEQLEEKVKNINYFILIGLLLIGGITGVHELHRTLVNTENGVRHGDRDIFEIAGGSNFSGSVDNPFIRYLCKDYHAKTIKNITVDYTQDSVTDQIFVSGAEFSVEENAPMAEVLRIVFDGVAEGDIYFYNDGMLDDTSVTSTIYVNGFEIGTLDYKNPKILIKQAFFTDYTQKIEVKMNRSVKLYEGDVFQIYQK